MPRESYIWNLSNPNFPEKTLLAPSPLCSMAFNQKNPDIVVGGSYNGSLSFFDTRAGDASGVVKPFRTTILEKSHHDPVYDVDWKTVGKTLQSVFLLPLTVRSCGGTTRAPKMSQSNHSLYLSQSQTLKGTKLTKYWVEPPFATTLKLVHFLI